jgi:hypothetical protein
MQIALVAVVLLAGMWFTVLKPKPADETVTPAAATPAAPAPTASAPVAPGVKGLATAVDKAKGAAAASDAANAKVQSATGGDAASPATATATKSKGTKSTATATKAKKAATGAAAAKSGTKAATAKAAPAPAKAKAAPAKTTAATTAVADPSARLLAYLAKGKTLVILFEGKGADDKAARKAVHRTAKSDPKHVVSAYIPIKDVGKYEAITSGVQVLSAPSILVIGTDRKATLLSGYVDVQSVRQAVGDARRAAAPAKKK